VSPAAFLLAGLAIGIGIGGLWVHAVMEDANRKLRAFQHMYDQRLREAPRMATTTPERLDQLHQQALSNVIQLTTKNPAAMALVREIRETGDLASRRSDEGTAPRRTAAT
jgi:hypothetical protein